MSKEKYILVIADESKEMEVALLYACARSKKTNRKIIISFMGNFIKQTIVIYKKNKRKII